MKKYVVLAATALLVVNAFAQTEPFGTFTKPFAADSPWNIRPIGPVFGTYSPPKAPINYGAVGGGIFSSRAFLASPDDPQMVVYPPVGQASMADPDAGGSVASVTIPRWPAATTPATGSDGHADIVDPITGRVHSFWQLKFANGQWHAALHAWSQIDGRGWGDPGHHYQGARATGVPTLGGMIRAHEVDDGKDHYEHALAISLAHAGLSRNPPYIYPATSADKDATWTNAATGGVPEGTLLMLPPDYVMGTDNPLLKKVVETLKIYGARVVDRNTATPFVIYVENGANFPLYQGGDVDTNVYREMERMRAAMRQVVSAYSYVDGNGNPTTANEQGNFNILSMRGPWERNSASGVVAPFNSLTQSIEFPAQPNYIEQKNGNSTGIAGGAVANGGVIWGRPEAGAKYRVTGIGTGGARVKVILYGTTTNADTGWLLNGQSSVVTWPAGGWALVLAQNPANQAGSIRATMIKQ